MSEQPGPWKLRMVTQGRGRGQTVTVWLNDEEVAWCRGPGEPRLMVEGAAAVDSVKLELQPPRRWFSRISHYTRNVEK